MLGRLCVTSTYGNPDASIYKYHSGIIQVEYGTGFEGGYFILLEDSLIVIRYCGMLVLYR